MKFTLAQLEAVAWIVRLGTFRAAAKRLSITQPAISVRVREPERFVVCNLFEDDSYPFTLVVLRVGRPNR